MTSVIGIIPARFASTRFPGKPLAKIGDKTMIQHVYERASEAKLLQKVIVATDDNRIFNAVNEFGGAVMMTSTAHKTGSDRIAEVAAEHPADIIVNIQGDEPFTNPLDIDKSVQKLIDSPDAVVSTLITPIHTANALHNPGVVKVVLGANEEALYFSRAVIPYIRDMADTQTWLQHGTFYEHVGLYVFRKDILMQFIKWPQGTLEKLENLEQLRLLENGYKIVCAEIKRAAICIDTPEDLQHAQHYWEEHHRVK